MRDDFKNKDNFSWPLVGNRQALDFLSRSLAANRLAQVYIFAGPEEIGKTTYAYCFARNLMLSDSNSKADLESYSPERLALSGDFHVLEKEEDKKNISISQVRELIKTMEMGSFANSYKIAIIKEAETLSLEGMNALLKLLEEPKDKVILILITSQLESLLKTIVSRAQVINFALVKTEDIHDYLIKEHKASPSQAKNISRLSLGRPALALRLFQNEDFYNNYVSLAALLLSLSQKKLSERFREVENYLKDKKGSSESVAAALLAIKIWEGVSRDLILYSLGHHDFIQHDVIKEEIKEVALGKNLPLFRSWLKEFKTGRDYLSANVNPKNVLENIVLSL